MDDPRYMDRDDGISRCSSSNSSSLSSATANATETETETTTEDSIGGGSGNTKPYNTRPDKKNTIENFFTRSSAKMLNLQSIEVRKKWYDSINNPSLN